MNIPQTKVHLVVEHIQRHIEAHGRPPSKRELAAKLGCDPSTIKRAKAAAIRMGAISREHASLGMSLLLKQSRSYACRTGRCRPETAAKIVTLLNTDDEARGLWRLLLVGESRHRNGVRS